MEATIYRYKITRPNWGEDVLTESILVKIASLLMEQPFYGDDPKNQFGFTQCGYYNSLIYGLFVQKFPSIVIDYHPKTKEELIREVIDCGEYLFVLDLLKYEIFFQTKKAFGLPTTKDINSRFVALLNLALDKVHYFFGEIVLTEDEIDRDKIVRIFYEVADKVTALDLEGFDMNLIKEEKIKRGGKRQTYFNPIEEYQEAMEEGAFRLGQHAEKASIKAKDGESLKKDPITRAMLESSKVPVKIVFIVDNIQFIEYGVSKSKFIINVEGDSYNLKEQIEGILSKYFGDGLTKPIVLKKKSDQGSLEL
jgi:hypothetical protein